jgi:hypothetical protein
MTEIKKAVFRSVAYPAVSLPEAIDLIKKIRESLGKTDYSRAHMLKALGYSADGGEAARKVAALVQFGLVDRAGSVYKYRDLSDKILFPTSDEMFANAILEAVKNPSLYNKLLMKYKGQSLPTLLSNILTIEFKVGEKVSRDVLTDFVKSIEFAGLYKNGVVSNNIDEIGGSHSDKGEDSGQAVEDGIGKDNFILDPNVLDCEKQNLGQLKLLKLPCGAILYYPVALEYDFAMGEFKNEIKALNDKIARQLESLI